MNSRILILLQHMYKKLQPLHLFKCKLFQLFTRLILMGPIFQRRARNVCSVPHDPHIVYHSYSWTCDPFWGSIIWLPKHVFMENPQRVASFTERKKPSGGISSLTWSHFSAQRSDSRRWSSREENKWALMLLKSHHIIYGSICSGHLLELEITRQLVGVTLVTRHSVTQSVWFSCVVNNWIPGKPKGAFVFLCDFVCFIFFFGSFCRVTSPPVLSGMCTVKWMREAEPLVLHHVHCCVL